MIESPDLWAALPPVIDALEALGVPYNVGAWISSEPRLSRHNAHVFIKLEAQAPLPICQQGV